MRVTALLILVSVFFVMNGSTFAQDDSTPPIRFVEWMSLENLDAGGPQLRTAVISPDASMIAWDDNTTLCIFVIDTAQQDCTDHPETPRIAALNLYWSPDSRIIAIEEDVFRRAMDGDLWLFDVENRIFVNRTDDGSEANLITNNDTSEPLLDVLPTWDPNNGDLYFLRIRPHQDNFIGLYRVNSSKGPGFLGLGDNESGLLGTGEPELVIDLTGRAETIHFSIFNLQFSTLPGAAAISPDGTRIAFLVRAPDPSIASNGVWIVDLLTDNVEVISRRNFQTGAGLPTWMQPDSLIEDSLTWTGNDLVVVLRGISVQGTNPVAYYADTATGRTTPLLDYSAFASLEEMINQEHSDGLVFIQVAIVKPDSNDFLYISLNPYEDSLATVWSLPLPPETNAQPQALTPSIDPDDFSPTSVNRPSYGFDGNLLRVLMGGYLYTFEITEEE